MDNHSQNNREGDQNQDAEELIDGAEGAITIEERSFPWEVVGLVIKSKDSKTLAFCLPFVKGEVKELTHDGYGAKDFYRIFVIKDMDFDKATLTFQEEAVVSASKLEGTLFRP